VLGPRVLTDNFYGVVETINHEFDHVRQNQAGSQASYDESEVDAWTSTFCRDFHRNYVIQVRGSTAVINPREGFGTLLGHYEAVNDSVREPARRRIREYHAQTIAPHPIHARVFRWWIYTTLKRSANPRLASELNSELGLGVDPGASAASMRQFPASELAGTSVPAAPSAEPPP
jgi:hypothetical protein